MSATSHARKTAPNHAASDDVAPSTAAAGGDADGAIGQLAAHAPKEAVEALVEQLERWATLGDGCRVASHAPPALEGAVPQHYQAVWGRVPTLVEWGYL